jgi:hypothetical protein
MIVTEETTEYDGARRAGWLCIKQELKEHESEKLRQKAFGNAIWRAEWLFE